MYSDHQPTITIEPNPAFCDEMTAIHIHGLKEHQEITVVTVLKVKAASFISCAFYLADVTGNVNMTTQPSYGGTYTGRSK
jgi:hypothetical protein